MKERSRIRADLATRADFCRVFEQEMKSLYLLAFLLTANHVDAERCLTGTMDIVLTQHETVFKDSVSTWIKYCLTKVAIKEKLASGRASTNRIDPWSMGEPESVTSSQIAAVTQLAPLGRFVFVMSVLERHSVKQCSVLLGCSQKTIIEERLSALKRLKPSGISSADRVLRFRQTA